MKLIKKIQKKDNKEYKLQFASTPSRGHLNNEPGYDPLEPFAWKVFFEEAQNMGMKVDIYALARTNFKIPPMPASVSENSMFGVSLDDIMERQKRKGVDSNIPNLLDQCIQYIYKYGLKEIGVFQSSSIDCAKVKKSRESIDAGNGVDVQLHEHLKYIDVHTVAGLLKQYIREFPTPIIPSDVFDMLLTSVHRGSEDVRKATHLLPRNSYNVLDKLLFLLNEVVKNTVYNETEASMLAESFGPALMWRNALTGGHDITRTRDIAAAFINNYSIIFSKGTTTTRPALGPTFFQPTGLSKSASLSTLAAPPSPLSTSPPSPSFGRRPSPSGKLSAPLSQSPTPSFDPSRSSAETPSTNYMLELYRNIKDGEDDSDEEVFEEFGEAKVPSRPTPQRSPSPPPNRERERERETDREREIDRIGMESMKKDKGKAPEGAGGRGMGMRKSVSENLANKYGNNNNNSNPQKKGGFGNFFKKIELKKKT